MHILDISHPNFEDQYRVVNETLAEIDGTDKPVIIVFNKIDAYQYEEKEDFDIDSDNVIVSIEELRKTWMARLPNAKVVFISAQDKENIEELRTVMYNEVKEIFQIRYPYHNFLY